ncbi:hypothetical protein HXX76_007973 [Chlamydomonas incerta]|uniref:Uncharacterized protein n=1 Tax=Chlamydomonas incerta TaxID=51695 RepID=A0A835W1X5_CHLIN|nr:hypothetical protein HXX76_007973 [Chlamydomonas incerta]|eukprot:KAG2434248.1 hypothetical protein HXX76_007973 [Chlamydomonas incerta]
MAQQSSSSGGDSRRGISQQASCSMMLVERVVGAGSAALAPASPSSAAWVAAWPAFCSPRRRHAAAGAEPLSPGPPDGGKDATEAATAAAGGPDSPPAPSSAASLLSLPGDLLQRVLVDAACANLAAQQQAQQQQQQQQLPALAAAADGAAAAAGPAPAPGPGPAAPVPAVGAVVGPLRPQQCGGPRRSSARSCPYHHVPAAAAAAACRGLRDAWRGALGDPPALARLLVARYGRRGVAALHVYGVPAVRIAPPRIVAAPPRGGYVVIQDSLTFLGPPRISRDGLEAYCMLQGAGSSSSGGGSSSGGSSSSGGNSSCGGVGSCGRSSARSSSGGARSSIGGGGARVGSGSRSGGDARGTEQQEQQEPGCGSPCLRALLRGLPPDQHGEAVVALVRALAAHGGLGDLQLPPASPPGGGQPTAAATGPPPAAAAAAAAAVRLTPPPGPVPYDEIIFLPATAFGRGRGYYAAFRQQLQSLQHGQPQRPAPGGRVGRGPAAAAAAVLLRGAAAWDHGALVRALVAAGAPFSAVAEGLLGACEGGHVGLARELLAALGVVLPPAAATTTATSGATNDAAAAVAGEGGQLAPVAPQPQQPQPQPPQPEPPQQPPPQGRPASPASRERLAALLVAPLAAASQGRTAGHAALLRLLLAAGADPRAEHSEALACAAACGNRPAMRLLLRAGADPRAAGTLHPLVSAAEFLRLGSVLSLLATGAFSARDLAGAARRLLIPPFLSAAVSGITLAMSWLAVAALLLAASAPLVMVCVLACLWNGLWVVSALSVVAYGLVLALGAAAVGLVAGLALAAWGTGAALFVRFVVRALRRRVALDSGRAAGRAASLGRVGSGAVLLEADGVGLGGAGPGPGQGAAAVGLAVAGLVGAEAALAGVVGHL